MGSRDVSRKFSYIDIAILRKVLLEMWSPRSAGRTVGICLAIMTGGDKKDHFVGNDKTTMSERKFRKAMSCEVISRTCRFSAIEHTQIMQQVVVQQQSTTSPPSTGQGFVAWWKSWKPCCCGSVLGSICGGGPFFSG